jgi:hypothetical protein
MVTSSYAIMQWAHRGWLTMVVGLIKGSQPFSHHNVSDKWLCWVIGQ